MTALHQCQAFEDILDGYFPLAESARQMLVRQGLQVMWITLLQAPVMTLPGLGPTEPVPLHVPKIHAGLIDQITLCAALLRDGTVVLAGAGQWFWTDGRAAAQPFPTLTRLGEPAFVRGVGLVPAPSSETTTPDHLAWTLTPFEPGIAWLEDRDLGKVTLFGTGNPEDLRAPLPVPAQLPGAALQGRLMLSADRTPKFWNMVATSSVSV